MEIDIFTIGWVISLILLSIDLWLTNLTLKEFYNYKLRTSHSQLIAIQETLELEKNPVVNYFIRKYRGNGILFGAIFTSAFLTLLLLFVSKFGDRDGCLLGIGAFIGMQTLMIQIHGYNLEDLKLWNYGKNH